MSENVRNGVLTWLKGRLSSADSAIGSFFRRMRTGEARDFAPMPEYDRQSDAGAWEPIQGLEQKWAQQSPEARSEAIGAIRALGMSRRSHAILAAADELESPTWTDDEKTGERW